MPGVLVAASWGSPYGWGLARYVYGGSEAEARTSLAALARVHPEAEILVVAVDTVYTATRSRQGCEPQGRPRDAPGSYLELLGAAKRGVEDWLRVCSGSGLLAEALAAGRLRVEIAPGVGSYTYYGARYRFIPGGEPLGVYAAWAVGLLLERLLERRPTRLIVDVTHGVNYMPLGLVMAARVAATAYAAATGSSLVLEVVNSEPYPHGARSVPRLAMWRVEERSVEPGEARDMAAQELRRILSAAQRGEQRLYRLNRELLPKEALQRLGPEINRSLEAARGLGSLAAAAANIVLYSMPLAAAYLAAQTPRDTLVMVLGLHREARVLAAENGIVAERWGEIHTGPGLVLSWDGVRALVYAAALLEAIHAAARAAGLEPGCLEQEGASTSQLRGIAERLGSLYHVVAVSELRNLERVCARQDGREKICPLELGLGRWPCRPCDKKAWDSLDARNLRAHAGLERNIVEAMLAEDGLRLRYRLGSPGCWERLLQRLGDPRF